MVAYRERGRDTDELRQTLGIHSVFDLSAALEPRPDFAIIANPTSLHIPVALEVARAGCHLFVEKPLSDTWNGVEELIALVSRRQLVTLNGFDLRFHRGLQLARSWTQEGRIGRVVAIHAQVGHYLPDWHPFEDYRGGYSARRDLGGGVILDLIHELDYACWIVGAVRQVFCFADHLSRLEIDTEDTAGILLRFEQGAIGTVCLDYVQRTASRTCRIVGEAGTILWDYFANEVRIFETSTGDWQVSRQEGTQRNDRFLAEMRHFLACLRGDELPVVNLSQGADVLKIALAARTSAESGCVMSLH